MSFLAAAVARVDRLAVPILASLPRGLIRFLIVGCSGLVVDISVLGLLEHAGLHKAWARAISLALATVFTWVLNRYFTFGGGGRSAGAEFGRYAVVAAVAQTVNYLIFLGLSDLFPRLPHALAAFVGAIAATGFSYSGQRFFTFVGSRPEEGA